MTNRLNLIETIAKDPKFSTFSRFMNSTNANDLFKRPGGFTVFVPTNDAFAKIPDEKMNELLNEPGLGKLKAILSYHIVPGRIMAANIGGQQIRNSVSGEEINFADYQGIKVNGEPVQSRNIEATDGVVHSLGTVLSPPPLAGEKPLPSGALAADTPPVPAQLPADWSSAAVAEIPHADRPRTAAASASDSAKPIF